MKQRRRKTRITIRKQEVLIVRGAEHLADMTCPFCGGKFPVHALAASPAQEDETQAGLKDAEERKLLPMACPDHSEA
jgi:hypothetical protein